MSTVVNAYTGQVLGIVDGRDSAAVGGWLAARGEAWKAWSQVVAIDPSAAFKKAIRGTNHTHWSALILSTSYNWRTRW